MFTFLQELEGLSFPEAVVKVADFEQIPLEDQWRQRTIAVQNPESATGKLIMKKQRKSIIMLLHTKAGQPALEYLQSRGLSLELIEEFNIGFALIGVLFLQQVFKNESISNELLERSGLFVT